MHTMGGINNSQNNMDDLNTSAMPMSDADEDTQDSETMKKELGAEGVEIDSDSETMTPEDDDADESEESGSSDSEGDM